MTTNEINKQVLKIKKENLVNFIKSTSSEIYANKARKNVIASTIENMKKDIEKLEAKINE
jgi:hypothetical protein